jgi:hypothetical protein
MSEDWKKKQRFKNRPVARIVCWRCKRGPGDTRYRATDNQEIGRTLYRVRYEDGTKSPDYVCDECKQYGPPPIYNLSYIKFPTQEELDALEEAIKQQGENIPKSAAAINEAHPA